jgi:lipoprotein-anchoring transpeptidase ErfK/SrfK
MSNTLCVILVTMSRSPRQHRHPRPGPIAGFLDRYGWRAYALPVLALLTLVALFRSGGSHDKADAAAHAGPVSTAATTPAVTTKATTTKATTTKATTTKATTTKAKTSAPKVRTITLPSDPDKAGAAVSPQTVNAAEAAPCAHNTAAKLVAVSIAKQHAWMCAGHKLVYTTPVTTGAVSKGDATPTGTFHIQGNVTNTILRGSDYAVHVRFWIQFNGDIGFHDAPWQTMAYGSAGYRELGSRGCVHMPLNSITWLHSWVQIGKTVVTVTKT